ncbi:MAG TPA: LPXTG cell wall anchor domain-containing protein, partial [Candidatus Blautia pullicola]|nr:LPXTG cell wall anchor domain-containing protein [Candidatus Blautia pullicola]
MNRFKKQSETTVTGSLVDSNKANSINTNFPQTGDNTQVVLWAALLAGAILVIAGSLIVYKKK